MLILSHWKIWLNLGQGFSIFGTITLFYILWNLVIFICNKAYYNRKIKTSMSEDMSMTTNKMALKITNKKVEPVSD